MRRKRKTSPNCAQAKKTVTPIWIQPGEPYLATCFCAVNNLPFSDPGISEIADLIDISTEPVATTSKGGQQPVHPDMVKTLVTGAQQSGEAQQPASDPCLDFIENPYYVVLKRYIQPNLFGHNGTCNPLCNAVACCELFRFKTESSDFGEAVKVQFRIRACDGKTVSVDEYPFLLSLTVNDTNVDVGKFPCLTNQDKVPTVRGKLVDVTHCFYRQDGMPYPQNIIRISSSSLEKRKFICSFRFVRERTLNTLLTELQCGPTFSSKDVLGTLFDSQNGSVDDDDDVMLCTAETSLLCPITFTRMTIPCRGIRCKHLDCFDAGNFLRSNKEQIEWLCPLCKCRIGPGDLRVDELLSDILRGTGADVVKAEVSYDGLWTPVGDCVKEEFKEQNIKSENVLYCTGDDSEERSDIISLSSGDEQRSTSSSSGSTEVGRERQPISDRRTVQRARRESPEIIDLTADDSASETDYSGTAGCSECGAPCGDASAAPAAGDLFSQDCRADLPCLGACRSCYPVILLSPADRCPQSSVACHAESLRGICYTPAAPLNIQQPYPLSTDIPSTSPMTAPYLQATSTVSNVMHAGQPQQGAPLRCPFMYRPNMYLYNHPH